MQVNEQGNQVIFFLYTSSTVRNSMIYLMQYYPNLQQLLFLLIQHHHVQWCMLSLLKALINDVHSLFRMQSPQY